MNFQSIIDFIRSLYPGRDTIPLHEPYFGGNEKKFLLDCIDSTYVSSVGRYVDRFEEMVRELTGTKYAVATVNGTAALHIALLLAGVQRGDLVITQPLTFIATCNAIRYCGAEPVFIDIYRKTLGLSADTLEAWLSANTIVDDGTCYYECVHELYELTRMNNKLGELSDRSQHGRDINPNHKLRDFADSQFAPIRKIRGRQRISACVPMHTFGHPCEIERIVEICERYHIPVVEDSAESLGSNHKDRHTGTFGKLGIFSFNGNKTITTGGGGVIITDDEELGILAKHVTTTAKLPHPWKFEHDMTGYNYRMPNINAALGCAQMEQLPSILANKRGTASQYQYFFKMVHDLEFIREPDACRSNYWLNAVLFPDKSSRDDFLEFTNTNRVMTRPAWTLMQKLPMFDKAICGNLEVAEDIESRLVNLPSSVRP